MTIWQVVTNSDYNESFLIDENGEQQNDIGHDFLEIQPVALTREIKIESHKKGFPDIMFYGGILGSCIVNHKVKDLLETNFSELAIQFFPCICKEYPDIEMWILNVCEYHDLFDYKKSVYRTIINHKGEEKISFIKKFVFKKEAFDIGLFKIYIDGYKSTIRLYVNDHFKAIMEENGVTGLNLKPVYSI